MNNINIEQINIASVFNNIKYVVPIYQRNYAWKGFQIEQLLNDINEAKDNYYLGSLITNQIDNTTYEVIDGQQRLTTLYLLSLYLLSKHKISELSNDSLQFEARDNYRKTLLNIKNGEKNNEFNVKELANGYNIIKSYFSTFKDIDAFIKKLEKVFIVRIQVPLNIDLNHYFEIMNTRGEQLELHQIVKARILSAIEDDNEKNIASIIWDCCSNMNSYVQMNFTKAIRGELFTDDWSGSGLINKDWNGIKSAFSSDKSAITDAQSLVDILEQSVNCNDSKNDNGNKGEEDNQRFTSVISFPNFLLHVNAVIKGQKDNNINEENDDSLDDKLFITSLKTNWENDASAKNFILKLLQCRTLFDTYIIKREFTKDYQQAGKWSLKKLSKYKYENGDKPQYIATYNERDNKLILTLQSALRITYTSPKTMHWITLVLKNLIENKTCNLQQILENYCRSKLFFIYEENNEQKLGCCYLKQGFEIDRIVFSYLDYLLYRENYSKVLDKLNGWEFQFRNSIEHFYPQHPIEGAKWGNSDPNSLRNLDSLGNLALITVSGNSKFSNLLPTSKIDTYKSIIDQSLKLKLMSNITKNSGWTQDTAKDHANEMIELLKEDTKQYQNQLIANLNNCTQNEVS